MAFHLLNLENYLEGKIQYYYYFNIIIAELKSIAFMQIHPLFQLAKIRFSPVLVIIIFFSFIKMSNYRYFLKIPQILLSLQLVLLIIKIFTIFIAIAKNEEIRYLFFDAKILVNIPSKFVLFVNLTVLDHYNCFIKIYLFVLMEIVIITKDYFIQNYLNISNFWEIVAMFEFALYQIYVKILICFIDVCY